MTILLLRKHMRQPRDAYRALNDSHPSLMHLIRFIVSGGTATAVNLGALFIFTHLFQLWYLASSAIAFIFAFFVSFTMQKLWTFGDSSRAHLHSQALTYFAIILVGLAINTTLLYVLVEYARFHYLSAQLVSGIGIAIMNYFSYKHLVFHDRTEKTGSAARSVSTGKKTLHTLMVILAIGWFASLASYRLSENPPTWMDEGSIVQVSINLTKGGTYGIQTSPGHLISTDFLTTSFPVIYPIAASFLLFGTDLLSARVVMVIFMTLLCWLAYRLIHDLSTERKYAASALSLLLIVTFAPLYGHGKNVLGEVPGLMFFLASLFVLRLAVRNTSTWVWFLSGALAGLAMATKPIFLFIIAPSALILFLMRRRHLSFTAVAAYAAGSVLMLLAWFFIHVGNIDALSQILFAANAENATLTARIARTGMQFLSELQPMYFLGLMALWCGSVIMRWQHRVEIQTIELYAVIFSVVNLALYMFSRGFYRYFFPAELLALMFLPLALLSLPTKERYQDLFFKSSITFILALVLFQGYQTLFNSWIAEYRSSTRSALLAHHLSEIPEGESVFFYSVPEAVIFFPSQNYYQYLHYGDNVIRGKENLPLLFGGASDFLLIDQKFPYAEEIDSIYIEIARFDKYVLYQNASRGD